MLEDDLESQVLLGGGGGGGGDGVSPIVCRVEYLRHPVHVLRTKITST